MTRRNPDPLAALFTPLERQAEIEAKYDRHVARVAYWVERGETQAAAERRAEEEERNGA